MRVAVVIPAFDEQESIVGVVERCRKALEARGDQSRVVVADNGSRDETGARAQTAGAEVVAVARRGYGAACLGAIRHLRDWPDVLLFIDADGSSRPEQMDGLLDPIRLYRSELTLGCRPPDSPMTLPQRWGTWLAVSGINWRWRQVFRDIGPFRAIRRESFEQLDMQDRTWGWTVEMQILAVQKKLRIEEVPVAWETRVAGVSKISGTFSGVVRAGARIIWTLVKYGVRVGNR